MKNDTEKMLKKVKEYFLPWLFGPILDFMHFVSLFQSIFQQKIFKRKVFVRGKNFDKKCRKMLAKYVLLFDSIFVTSCRKIDKVQNFDRSF